MSNYKQIASVFLMTAFSSSASADIYKCKNASGSPLFQDRPCANKSAEQIVSSPQAKLCYQLTTTDGETLQIKDFWTDKHAVKNLFYAQMAGKKTPLLIEEIESVKVTNNKSDCASARFTNAVGKSFDADICKDIAYLSDKSESVLPLGKLDSIKSCQQKLKGDGIWTWNQNNYVIQSAYASYSKSSNRLRVLLFPFLLNKVEEEDLLKQHNVDSLLNSKPEGFVFGIVFNLAENVTVPKVEDVVQFQSLLINREKKVERNYDRNWRQAISISKFQMDFSKPGGLAQISWTLTDRDQQAKVTVSVPVVEENF